MPAYVVANVSVEDPETYEQCRSQVLPTVERYDRRFLARGGRSERLEGAYEPVRFVILEFPSYEHAKEWHDSDQYRPLRELRQRASTGDLILVEGA